MLEIASNERLFGGRQVPRVVSGIDVNAAELFVTFFNSRVRDLSTKRRLADAIVQFCEWLDRRRHDIYELRPMTVSIYLEHLRFRTSAALAKEHWIALRIFFEWIVEREILEINPAAVVLDPELGLSWPQPTRTKPADTGLIEVETHSPRSP